jgi:hypothetical protein
VARLECVEVSAVGALYAPNDGAKRTLAVATNAAADSTVVLGAWDQEAKAVAPLLTAGTKAGVVATKTVTAPGFSDGAGATVSGGAVSAAVLTDGKARVSGGVITGVSSLTAGTLTDGTAKLSGGALTGVAALNATSVTASSVTAGILSDGTATLSGGVLSGATLAGNAVHLGGAPGTANTWRITVNPANNRLLFQHTADGKTYVTKQTMAP